MLHQIVFLRLGALLYEFGQPFLGMTLDIKDVIATILGGLLSVFLYKRILRKYKIKD